jgi:hypothetical protein
VLKAIATALNVSAETLLLQAGLLDDAAGDEREPAATASSSSSKKRMTTEDAIAADPKLTAEQRTALLAVYRSYLEANR